MNNLYLTLGIIATMVGLGITLAVIFKKECESGMVDPCIAYDAPYSDVPIFGSKKCSKNGYWGSCHAFPSKKKDVEVNE
jgi:hypothetical protein